MKVHLTQGERAVFHRLFDRLAQAEPDREKKRSLARISNLLFGPAPTTHLKPDQAALMDVIGRMFLQTDADGKHPERKYIEGGINRIQEKMKKLGLSK